MLLKRKYWHIITKIFIEIFLLKISGKAILLSKNLDSKTLVFNIIGDRNSIKNWNFEG